MYKNLFHFYDFVVDMQLMFQVSSILSSYNDQ